MGVIVKHGGRKRRRLDDEAYTAGHAFLLTACTRDRRPRFADPELARAACVVIEAASIELDQRLWAYCVMPDHVHLLVSRVDPRVSMRLIKGRLEAHGRRRGVGSLWQRSFHDRGVRSGVPLDVPARYTLENPVRAGLCRRASQYPHSGSLAWPDWRGWFSRG
jgi:REP element-mobilizing transposase RayT